MRRGYTKNRVIFFNSPSAATWGRPVATRRRFHLMVLGLVLLSLLAFLMAAYVFNNNYLALPHRTQAVRHLTTGQRLLRLTAVRTGDGLKVTWYSALNTRDRLQKALQTSSQDAIMFEGDVSPRSFDETRLPRDQLKMALTRDTESDLSLEEWLDLVIEANNGGLMLNFVSADSVELGLQHLASRAADLHNVPVWLAVNVVSGPGGDSSLIDPQWVLGQVNATYPRAQLVFGWTGACCGQEGSKVVTFGRGSMETMLKACQLSQQPVVISSQATQAALQWRHFRWLLESWDRLSLLLWSREDDPSWRNETSLYELLTVRNDWSKRQIFYDLPEERLENFRRLTETAGSPIEYLDLRDRDAAMVTWAHGTNTEEALALAAREGAEMLEADVSLEGLGTPRQTLTPIMAHRGPQRAQRNLTSLSLGQWLDVVLTTNKAIKLDLKCSEAVIPALKVLEAKRPTLHRPIWLSADILRGPNALHDPMNATHFIRSVSSIFPEVTLSLGWTSGWLEGQDNEAYSWEMVEKMEKIARKLRQPVTFAVRAVLARASWDRLEWLLHQSRRYTITLWHPYTASEPIDVGDLRYIRHQSERSRVYYDLPPDLLPELP